uniref:EF-hand domain-containing protein n=1 Tax=Oryzias melastigma TaxID=30732 RepID=A0A3B3BM52_ORYME
TFKGCKTVNTMTTIFEAIAILRKIFDKYAGKEGDAKTLTKKEITTLLKEQLGGDVRTIHIFQIFFEMLDADGDGVVEFSEYAALVASGVHRTGRQSVSGPQSHTHSLSHSHLGAI